MHTLSNFSPFKNFAQNFSLLASGRNFHFPKKFPCGIRSEFRLLKIFHLGIGPEIFLKAKGLQDDEEKDAINRSGMEVALGVYPDRQ